MYAAGSLNCVHRCWSSRQAVFGYNKAFCHGMANIQLSPVTGCRQTVEKRAAFAYCSDLDTKVVSNCST